MITVGWCPYKRSPIYLDKYEMEFVHNVYFEPEKLSELYSRSKSFFRECPAHTHFLKSFWVIKSPVDLELKLDRKNKDVRINQNQKFFDSFVNMRWNEYTDDDLALCSLYFQYMFVADEQVWMEQYPAFLHGGVDNTRFINAGFNIYNWQRPIDFSFEIIDDKKPVIIKRGQPLFYVKFIGEKLNEDFKLKEIEWTDELYQMNKRCQPQNWIKRISWQLMNKGNRKRPKKLVK